MLPVQRRLCLVLFAASLVACGGEPPTSTQTASASASTRAPTASASSSADSIPSSAFEATDPRGFTKAAEGALAALLEKAAKSCPKKSPPEPGQLDVSPARDTVWDKEPRVLEVAVI